ncbi:MAG: hypothetical protein AB1758_03525, partial [Candidatus Eremiobacterota bacterium]
LEAWPATAQPLVASLDDRGLLVEVEDKLTAPERLQHLIRVGVALVRACRKEANDSQERAEGSP